MFVKQLVRDDRMRALGASADSCQECPTSDGGRQLVAVLAPTAVAGERLKAPSPRTHVRLELRPATRSGRRDKIPSRLYSAPDH